MRRYEARVIEKARILRKRGLSYEEISKELQVVVPKATIAFWMRGVPLSVHVLARHKQKQLKHLIQARLRSAEIRASRQSVLLNQLDKKHAPLSSSLKREEVAKIVLGILYLAEGSKGKRAALTFGNSDPRIIALFLKLLRDSYPIDESKFRCTIQGRADQDFKKLLGFWSKLTKIPMSQFYSPRIDSRSIGKPTKKHDYKGVCKIDYLSAKMFNEITSIGRVLTR